MDTRDPSNNSPTVSADLNPHYGATESVLSLDETASQITDRDSELRSAASSPHEAEEDIEDPHQASGIKHELSPFQASLNMIKAIVGAGSFSLPFAFYHSGVLIASILIVVLAILSIYTLELLNYIEHSLNRREHKLQLTGQSDTMPLDSRKTDLTYPDIAEKAFPSVSIRMVCCCTYFCQGRRRRQEQQTTTGEKGQVLDAAKTQNSSNDIDDEEFLMDSKHDRNHCRDYEAEPVGARKCCYSCMSLQLSCIQGALEKFPARCCQCVKRYDVSSKRHCSRACATVICCCGTSRRANGEHVSYLDTNFFRLVVYLGFVATSVLACAAYVDFIAATLPQVVPKLDRQTTVLAIFPILIALGLIRSFRILAFTSILGNIAVSSGLCTVVLSGFFDNNEERRELRSSTLDTSVQLAGTVKGFFRAFGSIAFLFAVHIIIYPIMQSMKRRKDFPKTIVGTYSFVTLINGAFAILSVLLFSANTQSNVVDNLPSGFYADAVKILLCVDLLFTVPIVLGAARSLIEDTVVPQFPDECDTHVRNVVRMILLLVIAAICMLITEFSNLVDLVGGVVNCLMGYVLPPLMYMKIRNDEDTLSKSSRIGHSVLLLVGVTAAIVSFVVTTMDIIDGFS